MFEVLFWIGFLVTGLICILYCIVLAAHLTLYFIECIGRKRK